MAKPMHFFKYLKTAFLNRWNLLFFLGALGFSLLSSRADVLTPLVLAGEISYVALLGSHLKFQRYVDAQEAKALRDEGAVDTEATLRRILQALPAKALSRFEALRTRCLELRQIASELKDPALVGSPASLEEVQLAGLDRLLWVFLRLLFTQHSLERFLGSTNEPPIQKEAEKLEARIKGFQGAADDPQSEKRRKALEDNLETCRARLANVRKARDNYELVGLEIDRLENKIQSLSELSINRHEPDFISSQVDQVASSMLHTERTMSELQFATGLGASEEAVPSLTKRQTLRATE